MRAIKEKTIRGGAAKFIGQVHSVLVRVGTLVVLTHTIDPGDFGLVAMVTAISGVFDIVTGGLSAATIQKADVSHEQVSTLFWINIAISASLMVLCMAGGPIVAAFYHEPRTVWIMASIAPALVINAASVQHVSLMQRELRYVAITLIEIISQSVAAGLAIGLALAGYGYWALVANMVAASIVTAVGAWAASGWRPGRPRLDNEITSLLRFGGTVTVNGLVVYVGFNFEKVLLGRYWGSDALGLYGRAFQLISLPTSNLNAAIGGVAFAALSRLQNDPERFRTYFLRGYSVLLSMTVPATIFCALFADDIVVVVLGPAWTDAAVISRLLSPTILIFGIINPLGWLLPSIGKQRRSLKIAFVVAPLVNAACVVGLPFGPSGVALAYSTALAVWLVPHVMWCLHGTVISVRDLCITAARPLLSGAVAALAATALSSDTAGLGPPVMRLALGGVVMLSVYAWFLLIIMQQKSFYFGLLTELFPAINKFSRKDAWRAT